MLVVSNTSPLTNLLAIDRLQLLSKLYDTVAVPDAVFQEITMNSDEVQPSQGLITKQERKISSIDYEDVGWHFTSNKTTTNS